MGRCLRWSRCLRAIHPLNQHCPSKPRPHYEQLRLWLGRLIPQHVRPVHACIQWVFCRHARPTCLKTLTRGRATDLPLWATKEMEQLASATSQLFIQSAAKAELCFLRYPCLKPKPCKDKSDLRNVILARKASAKRY